MPRWTDIKSGVQEVMCARDLHLGVLSIHVTFKDFLKGSGERSIPTFRNQVEKEKLYKEGQVKATGECEKKIVRVV